MAIRTTQQITETLASATPAARNSQVIVESLATGTPAARIEQEIIEMLTVGILVTSALTTQLTIEVLVPNLDQTLTVDEIISEEAFGSPTLDISELELLITSITSDEFIGTPTVSTADLEITTNSIDSSELINSPQLNLSILAHSILSDFSVGLLRTYNQSPLIIEKETITALSPARKIISRKQIENLSPSPVTPSLIKEITKEQEALKFGPLPKTSTETPIDPQGDFLTEREIVSKPLNS